MSRYSSTGVVFNLPVLAVHEIMRFYLNDNTRDQLDQVCFDIQKACGECWNTTGANITSLLTNSDPFTYENTGEKKLTDYRESAFSYAPRCDTSGSFLST